MHRPPLDSILQAAATSTSAHPDPQRWAAIRSHLARGWNPERIEWQRWLRRWSPWAAAATLISAATIASLPHGTHKAPHPPALVLFSEPPASPATPTPP